MKPSRRLASLVLARLGQGLNLLKEAFSESVPRQHPLPVPIPIRAVRRPARTNRRPLGWGD